MASGLDEVIFRATERAELLQLQVAAGVGHAKEFLLRIQHLVAEAWNNPALRETLEKIVESSKSVGLRAVEGARETWHKVGIEDLPSPQEIVRRLNLLFSDRMWRHSMLMFAGGIVCGTIVGVSVGWQWRSRILIVPHYKALHSLSDGTAVVVEDAAGATVIHQRDVLIRINSFTVEPLDRDVLRGRGKRLRDFVRPSNGDVTVGRSFSGVITEMGSSVTRLEIGDEVWGTVAEWEGGAAQELISAPAHRIGRSPQALPPQAAASLPRCGALALHHLRSAGLNKHSAQSKRVLIIGAGAGSGCVILQLLKSWKAITTAVCDRRAQHLVTALGAQDATTVDWCDDNGKNDGADANLALADALVKDLVGAGRDLWDYVFVCRAPKAVPSSMLNALLSPSGGTLVDMRPKDLLTDRVGNFLSLFYGLYVSFRKTFSWIRGINGESDFLLPISMDAEVLDCLASFVENGTLQTVVDKVYKLKDFELALAHACSVSAIGCTVVRIS